MTKHILKKPGPNYVLLTRTHFTSEDTRTEQQRMKQGKPHKHGSKKKKGTATLQT